MQRYDIFNTNEMFKDILEKYIRERIKNEVRNAKLENKIARLRSGSKKQYRKYSKKMNLMEREVETLKKENDSLKLGMMHRDEIINYIFENVEDEKIKEYLKRSGIPNDF